MRLLTTVCSLLVLASLLNACGRRQALANHSVANLAAAPGADQGHGVDHYLVFDAFDQAAAWYESFRPLLSAAHGADSGGVIPANDERYAPLKEMVSQLWAAYQHRFPAKVGSIPEPVVLLLKNDARNAFAVYDPRSELNPNVFFVNAGLTSEKFGNKAEVLGVLAHELAHHVQRHSDPKASDAVSVYYQIGQGQPEPLGFQEQNDAALAGSIKLWTTYAGFRGDLVIKPLHGVPMSIFGNSDLELAAVDLQKRSQSPDCSQASALSDSIFNLLEADYFDQRIHPKTENLGSIGATADSYRANIVRCLAAETRSWMSILEDYNRLSESEIMDGEAQLSPDDMALLHKSGPAGDNLLAIADSMAQEMRAIEQKVDFSTVRVYTPEEQADDLAAQVLLDIGKTSQNLTQFFMASLGDRGKQCQDLLDAGTVPPYGSLADEHHTNCYRIFHLQALERLLLRDPVAVAK